MSEATVVPGPRFSLPPRYRPKRALGRGGMGEVWLVDDLELGRDVAVKSIVSGLGKDPTVRARLEREAATMASLEHPNVVRIYGCELGQDEPYLVMEYIEGETLEKRLATRRTLPVVEVLRLAEELGSALDALHARGIAHRDLKPANVMMRRNDGGCVLMDLGLARVAEGTALTDTGALVGTPAYLPPEAMIGTIWKPQSDLFQLAALLWECLAGTRMVTGRTLMDIGASLAAGSWSPLPEALPMGLRVALAKAASVDPDLRYPTGRALSDGLRIGLAPVPVRPTRPLSFSSSLTAPKPDPSPSRPRGPWLLGFMALALVAGALPWGSLFGRPAAEDPAAEPPAGPEPPFAGEPRLASGGVALELARACRIRTAGRPDREQGATPGTVVIGPDPGSSTVMILEWSDDGRSWRPYPIDLTALAAEAARNLVAELGDRDPLAAAESLLRTGLAPAEALDAERGQLASLGPWLEPALEARPDRASRIGLWSAWTRWAPAPAMLRSLGRAADDLPGAPGVPGLPFVPGPGLTLPADCPDLEPVASRVVPRNQHGWTLATEEARKLPLGQHSEAMAGLAFCWPAGLPQDTARLLAAIHVGRLPYGARLRIRRQDPNQEPWQLDLWVPQGLCPPDESWEGVLAVTLPASVAPAPGERMLLEAVRLARIDAYLVWASAVAIGPYPGPVR